MAGPDTLDKNGDHTNFPTWQWPKTTKFCAKSLDPNNYATVNVIPLFGSEEVVGTTGGGTTCIERSWAGVTIRVENIRNDMDVPVSVWTE